MEKLREMEGCDCFPLVLVGNHLILPMDESPDAVGVQARSKRKMAQSMNSTFAANRTDDKENTTSCAKSTSCSTVRKMQRDRLKGRHTP